MTIARWPASTHEQKVSGKRGFWRVVTRDPLGVVPPPTRSIGFQPNLNLVLWVAPGYSLDDISGASSLRPGLSQTPGATRPLGVRLAGGGP